MTEPSGHRYHSGKFCPITKANCRKDCVSLISFDFCTMIDGNFSLSRRIEDLLAELHYDMMERLEREER